jgi:hypothetical protein
MENSMSNTSKRSALPWRVGSDLIIRQDNRPINNSGVLIASVHGNSQSGFFPTDEEAVANAAFIVRAVNSHEQLVAALRDAESLIDTLALACIDRVDSVNDPRRATITAALSAAEA